MSPPRRPLFSFLETFPRRLFLLAPAVLLACIPAAAQALQPGMLTAVEKVETLTPAEVDRLVAGLFDGARQPAAAFAVDCYTLRFQSLYPEDSPASATAQLFLPRTEEAGPPALMYLFAPGSTGLINNCRPSREHIAGIHWGLYRSHVLAFAGQGMLGLLPDYQGFGDPGRLQPYMSAVSEGRLVLDAIRAARRFLEQKGWSLPRGKPAVFLAGFSQGGHAIFAAADLERAYAPEVRLSGIIGYGPTTDMEVLFREFPVSAPMAIFTYSRLYGNQRFNPALILQQRWARSLEHDVTRQCIGGMQQYYPWSARELFTPAFADALFAHKLQDLYPEIYRILRENSTGLTRHRLPCLILQGTDDIVIRPASQAQFARQLCQAGSPVRYVLYKGRHDTRQVGYWEALDWMRALADGKPAPSDCRTLEDRQ
jgi:acetyl esterase/lipase